MGGIAAPAAAAPPTDPGLMDARQLLTLYRRKALSPVEATRAALDRIARFNSAVNAFCLVDEAAALAAARESEARWMAGAPVGAVDGVPASIKDLAQVRGWPTRKGSLALPETPAAEDSPFAARLREQGAVILGKTTTPEFGWKGVTDSPLTGITRNPWDTSRTAGGSSGGAGAAAALNMGVLHQGSDAGGSIRIPCAFTGTVGLKPTFGFVPQWPASAMGTLSHLGPMTRTVWDTALLLTVTGRPDSRDWYAGAAVQRDWTAGLEAGIRGRRIAWSPTLGHVRGVEPEVARLTAAAVARLEDLGAIVEAVDPGFDDPLETFNTLWFAGAAHILRGLSAEQRVAVDPGLQDIARQGESLSLARYTQAQAERVALGEHMAAFHRRFDLLVTPAVPLTAFAAGRDVPEGTGMRHWMEWTPFSYPFNLTQQPAASVPCGRTAAGLPVGLHIVGPRFGDHLVLRAAWAYEQAQPPEFPQAPIAPPPPGS